MKEFPAAQKSMLRFYFYSHFSLPSPTVLHSIVITAHKAGVLWNIFLSFTATLIAADPTVISAVANCS